MIHYHGLPITPETAAIAAVKGGHAFVSFSSAQQLSTAKAVCQSFALDNGAFGAWRKGRPISDWTHYYRWVQDTMRHPRFDFAVIPDDIDGSEQDNDNLVDKWPFVRFSGSPVWHLHESLDRLDRLLTSHYRVCIGSSGEYATVATPAWYERMHYAMAVICPDGQPRRKIHGLRMLNPKIFSQYPFSSADSTNIARNIGIDKAWTGSYRPATKEGRAMVMRERIESQVSACRWAGVDEFGLPINISRIKRKTA